MTQQRTWKMDNQKQRVLAIIQARMGSSRLPGKVLLPLCGQPMLEWVVKRTKMASLIDEVIVATTTDVSDDVLAKFCVDHKVLCFRGSPLDVLDRYYQAALKYDADIVVRLTADCPLLDGKLIDDVIKPVLVGEADFCANRLPPPFKRTVPIGLDAEVVTFTALEKAWKEANLPYEREHVMPYLYTHPEKFNIHVIEFAEDLGTQRWTVDTQKDLDFVEAVLKEMSCRDDFGWQDIQDILIRKPVLQAINASVEHKTYFDVDERGKTREVS